MANTGPLPLHRTIESSGAIIDGTLAHDTWYLDCALFEDAGIEKAMVARRQGLWQLGRKGLLRIPRDWNT